MPFGFSLQEIPTHTHIHTHTWHSYIYHITAHTTTYIKNGLLVSHTHTHSHMYIYVKKSKGGGGSKVRDGRCMMKGF